MVLQWGIQKMLHSFCSSYSFNNCLSCASKIYCKMLKSLYIFLCYCARVTWQNIKEILKCHWAGLNLQNKKKVEHCQQESAKQHRIYTIITKQVNGFTMQYHLQYHLLFKFLLFQILFLSSMQLWLSLSLLLLWNLTIGKIRYIYLFRMEIFQRWVNAILFSFWAWDIEQVCQSVIGKEKITMKDW